jgi:hypothetical protein
MPLGLLPLGTGGGEGWVLCVGLVSLGTDGGRVPAGVIVDNMSVGTNYAADYQEGETRDEIAYLFSY